MALQLVGTQPADLYDKLEQLVAEHPASARLVLSILDLDPEPWSQDTRIALTPLGRETIAPMHWRCSGRSSATDEPCTFATNDAEAAGRHFEAEDHDLDCCLWNCGDCFAQRRDVARMED